MVTLYPNTPPNIKDSLFAHMIKDFTCAEDKARNNALLDALNDLEKAFESWNKTTDLVRENNLSPQKV